jgi:hypothetical protein
MTCDEVGCFGKLAERVYILATQAGLRGALPQVSELRPELESSQATPLPPVQFVTKLNLPGDWDAMPADVDGHQAAPLPCHNAAPGQPLPDEEGAPLLRWQDASLDQPLPERVFLPCASPRWYDDMAVLRTLVETKGGSKAGKDGQEGRGPTEIPSAEPKDSTPPDTTGPAKRKQGMTAEEANRKAMELVKKMKKVFFALSEREQAKLIGCTWRTWSKTEFYKTAKKKKPRQHPARGAPRTVSLSPAMEAVTGEGGREETLNKLIAEQEADHEPSPLEEDPPGDRPRKVYRPSQRL